MRSKDNEKGEASNFLSYFSDEEYFNEVKEFLKYKGKNQFTGIGPVAVLGYICGNDYTTGAILERLIVKARYYREVEVPKDIHKNFCLSYRSFSRKISVIESLPFITKIKNQYKNRRTYLVDVRMLSKMYKNVENSKNS